MRLAVLACVTLVLAASTPVRAAPDRVDAVTCPTVRLFSAAGEKTYALQFTAPQATTATIDATFETANAAYEMSLPAVAIVTGFGQYGIVTYRSRLITITNSATAPFIDARFTIAAPGADPVCSFQASATSNDQRTPTKNQEDLQEIAVVSTGVRSTPAFAHDLSPPTCAKPFVAARVSGRPAQPEYPAMARLQGATGTVLVRVALAPDGSIVNASIYRSSGNINLDNSALRAAGSTRYEPEQFRCSTVGGAYLFMAAFSQS